MINPCPRRILCPPGTGTDSPGTNYSSEHVDVPEYSGVYYPPDAGYNIYSACRGLCISTVSQEDADLCAARQAELCIGQATGKSSYGNTVQTCTEPGTGRTVIVPADVFLAGSVVEANAQALSYATKLQLGTTIPPGLHVVPPPIPTPGGTTGNPTPPNVIPTPGPVPRPRPPAPPTSHCKPCDDTHAESSFVLDFDVPSDTPIVIKTSPTLKCGTWQFCIHTITGGPLGYDAAVDVTAISSDPGETLEWAETLFNIPCGSDSGCSAADTPTFGLHSCCAETCTDVNANYLSICNEVSPTLGYLTKVRVYYRAAYEFTPPRHFTVSGTLLAPPP